MTTASHARPGSVSVSGSAKDDGPCGEISYGLGRASLGAFAVASNDAGVCAILLGDDAEAVEADLRQALPGADLVMGGRGYDITVEAVADLIERPWMPHALKLDLGGGDFERMIRAALSLVAPGDAITPEELASQIGAPGAARNVRNVVAGDLMAVAVPFHRLAEADGASPAYRWGEARRLAILRREALGA